jgi:hypothetical protein
MPSTENWWSGVIDWTTPAGRLLKAFLASLPPERTHRFTVYGSAALQLTVARDLLSGDVDIFSNDDEDLASLIAGSPFAREHGGLYLDTGFELSFRTSPRWRQRAIVVQQGNAALTIPHPLDILIGKLDRLEEKDLRAFERVRAITGHPTADEFKRELQNAVDLFRPSFEEESPNRYLENTERLWRTLFDGEIDVRREIIAPALARRREGYGQSPLDYKSRLGQ